MSDRKEAQTAPLVAGQVLEAGGEFEDDERVVHKAEFDPAYINYAVTLTAILLVSMFFTIPFLIFMPCIYYSIKAAFNSKEIIITEKTLVYKRGFFGCCCLCWNHTSKHVPLEKVTDITYMQGCLEKQYGLATIQIQTAGQNGPDGRPELSITGIRDAANFRKIVMAAKARCMEATFGGYGSTMPAIPVKSKDDNAAAVASTEVLVAMRDSLVRMEGTLQNIERGLAARATTPPADQ